MKTIYQILATGLRLGLVFGSLAALAVLTLNKTQTPPPAAPKPMAIAATRTPTTSGFLSQYNLPRQQTLVLLGGESNNPRAYDPATGGDNRLLYSSLVSFTPWMQITPDLAERWDVDDTRTVYTFHLRKNAKFHDGRSVTASDVVYSWDRAASPAIHSDNVMTYLNDIVGIQERNSGKSDHISGLIIIDDQTLRVQIDAPKPYFLMKLTYGPALIVDKANVESGVEWYRTPNGTGPYKLKQWKSNEVQIYERNNAFYLPSPEIRYIVYRLYAGVGVRLYESNQIDVTGVNVYDLDRVSNPSDPLHKDLRQSVSTCTTFVRLDVNQPPFDDVKVRQAFAHAVNRQQYIDIVYRGYGLPAKGLLPPAMPGHNVGLHGLDFDTVLAKKLISESRYAGAMPPIVVTSGGYGSDISPAIEALMGMWQKTLGVTITVQNLEPDHYSDEIYNGHHGQIVLTGWCADYLDPENFTDTLFHSGKPENWGHYSNTTVDKLLEQARIERNVATRMQLYQQAEQIIVEEGAAIFLIHPLRNILVKPYVLDYIQTPFSIPLERYLRLDTSKLRTP